MTRHPALGHQPLSHTSTSLLKRLACTLALLSASAQAADVTASWNAASDIPVTASSYTATGNTVNFALNFAPLTRMDLMVVKNTGLPFIQGRFSNLTQGQAVALSFGGSTYNYVANYYGGSGNDLVLQSSDVVLAAWGYNFNGQLGNGNTTNSSVPVAVTRTGVLAGKTVISVAAGENYCLALCSDGTVAAWGRNIYGQLGNGNTTNSSVPVAVTRTGVLAGKTVISIAAGVDYSLALCSDGTVAAWGANGFGVLGFDEPFSSVPLAARSPGVLAGKTVVSVAAGAYHCLALCSDGTVAAWGNNEYGQYGNGNKTSSWPVAVTRTGGLAGKTVTSVAAGAYHSLALCSDGTVAAWGRNDSGQLGNSNTTDSLVPVAVTSTGVLAGKTVISIAAGDSRSLAMCSDGTVAAWGLNDLGQLGNGTKTDSPVPVAVTSTGVLAGKTVISVAAGYDHSLALCKDGTLAAWGSNNLGQFGNGNTLQSSLPVVTRTGVLAGKAVISVAAGAYHSLALCSDGTVVPPVSPPVSPTIANIAQQAYVKASNTLATDQFGHAVAISGNTLVVGAPGEWSAATGINGDQTNDTARRAGAVYVYIRTGSTWTQQAYLKASNTDAADEFGSAVAIDGDTIVVGARGEASPSAGVNGNQADNSLHTAGAAYIFTRTGTTWTQQAYLKAGNGPSTSDRFGGAVAVSGNTVLIGAGGEDGSGTGVDPASNELADSSGAAYVFTRMGSTWSQQAYLKGSNTGFRDGFGASVGISGNTLIVGAPGEDGGGQGIDPASDERETDSGAAYVFTRSGTTWTEQSYIKSFNAGSGHRFGEAVAISGDAAVIGAPGEDGANIGIDSQPLVSEPAFGAAYVFERSDAAWTQTSYLKRCNPRGNYYFPFFGRSVAISGSTIVVGEFHESGSGTGINPPFDEASLLAGAAYVFVRNGNVWDKQAYLKASNTTSGDFFGSAVAVSDGSIVVGADGEDGGGRGVNPVSDELGANSGAAYVYTGAGVVNPQAPAINKPIIPEATRNVYISIPVQITGGGVLTCRVVSGTLPPGVTLNATTGAVSGTPTVAGNYAFTVRATNAYGSADVPLVINVAAGAADLAPPSMRPGTVLDYAGTSDDSLEGTSSESGELKFLTTTKFEGGSYAYTKTGPNTATVTYTLSYAEPGYSETENGTMLATFDSPTSGSYTVTGRTNGKNGSTPFNSTFSGSGTFSFTAVPDIAVALSGQSLASGGQVDFGKIGVGSGVAERSFTISNTSSADLTGLDITIDGPNASSFSVTTPPVSPVAQGGSTTFTVQSTVSSAGPQTATLHIASNDAADASYTIKLKATGLASAPALATTVAAAGITFEGATLKATVNANNSEQTIAFDYGLTTSYGSTIEAFPATATGISTVAVQYPVNGLLPHTKYFFRVKATGNAGTVYGSALSFTTLNRAPSIVGDDAAALPGEVLTLDALSNDVDEDGDALSMISVGSVSVSAGSAKLIAGKIVFTAAATFAGTPLAYTIADSLGARTTRQITIALAPCDLSPAAVSLPPAADSYTVGVATDNAWKVTENLPWASVSPTSGTGPGNVTVTLQENTAKASRSGVMMIGGHAHTITQSGSGGLTIEVPASIPEGMVSADYTLTIPALLPPVKFTATGLPTGLGINATSGEITGKPSAAGRFSASITGTTSAGASTKIVVPLVIQALPTGTIGSFTGLVSQDALSAGLGGSFALNVTSTGSYTGSLNLGLATHKFTGRVVAAVGENPTISLAIPRPSPAPSLTLALTFDGSNNALTGEVGDGTQPPATIDGRRSIWAGTSASDYAALYNTVAELPASDPDQPEGAAWEQMTVTAAGATTGTGRTADGIAYTFSGPLWPDGSQPHFVLIYNKHGSVIGLPTISLGTDLADNRVTGWIDQIKTGPTATTDRTYSAGLAYTRRNLDGSPWIKPTTTLPIVLDLADEAGNASIAFSGGGVEAENQFDSLAQTFRVNKNNSTTFPAATVLAGNPCKVSMAITPATGFFSGSFTLSDIVAGRTITRAISYAGILQSHTSQGHGYFLLPGLSPSATTSPITGGRVLVTK